MEKRNYKAPIIEEHETELEQLLIDVTSGETTEEQLSRMRDEFTERALREQEAAEYGNLW